MAFSSLILSDPSGGLPLWPDMSFPGASFGLGIVKTVRGQKTGMSKFDRYMLSQLMMFFGFFALVLVSIYWVNSVLR
jgi:hypothetical protein